jgi:hypothetical protein
VERPSRETPWRFQETPAQSNPVVLATTAWPERRGFSLHSSSINLAVGHQKTIRPHAWFSDPSANSSCLGGGGQADQIQASMDLVAFRK